MRPGPKCIQREDFLCMVTQYQPHTIFLQIGGNDLDKERETLRLSRDIISFSNFLVTCYNVNHVIIGQLIPRYSGRTDNNEKVIAVNKQLQTAVLNLHNVSYWKHRGIWKDTQSLLRHDKVHFNHDGMIIYAKNVRAAVGRSYHYHS